jgi:hypothetical protein
MGFGPFIRNSADSSVFYRWPCASLAQNILLVLFGTTSIYVA